MENDTTTEEQTQTQQEVSTLQEHSPEELKMTDAVFDFARYAASPTVALKVLKYVYSIQNVRPFLYKVRVFLQGNTSIPAEWTMPTELANVGGLSQRKALAFLEASKLWDAYIVYLRYGDRDKNLSRQVRKSVLDFVKSTCTPEGASSIKESGSDSSEESNESTEKKESFPWKEVDEEQRRQIRANSRRRARRNRQNAANRRQPMYYIQVDPRYGVPFISFPPPPSGHEGGGFPVQVPPAQPLV
jgi:hypothetical protein